MGRFLSEDPAGLAANLNLYLFALNNPVGQRDPFGLDAYGLDDAGKTALEAFFAFGDGMVSALVSSLLPVGAQKLGLHLSWTPAGDAGAYDKSKGEYQFSQAMGGVYLAAVGAAAGLQGGASASGAPPKDYVTLYRAVGLDEAEDIANSGVLRGTLKSTDGKWLAETVEDAAEWGRRVEWGLDGRPFEVIPVRVPKHVAEGLFRDPMLDGIGSARYANETELPSLIPGEPLQALPLGH
jgi:hypothetical protein